MEQANIGSNSSNNTKKNILLWFLVVFAALAVVLFSDSFVKKIAEKFKLPYFTLTPTFSICPNHGYLIGDHEYCPKCDEKINYSEKQELNLTIKGG